MATKPTTHHSLGLIAYLARVTHREAEALENERGLRPRHYVVLTLLRDHGASTQKGVAEALRLDPTNLVGALNDLEAQGLVTRRRDPEDRRRHIVDITDAGADELGANERRLSEVEDRVLGPLSDDEREVLHELLVRATGGQLPPGACAE